MMAKRWSMNEDIIVCKYCFENHWAYSSDYDIEVITSSLVKAGYAPRSRTAMRKRAHYYQDLRMGLKIHHIPNQVVMIYETLFAEGAKRRQKIKSYIEDVYNPNAVEEYIDTNRTLSILIGDPSDLVS